MLLYDPVVCGALIASNSGGIVNAICFEGNPILGPIEKTYVRGESADAFGYRGKGLRHFGIVHEDDADLLVNGLLDDLAYPEAAGSITEHHGCNAVLLGPHRDSRRAGAPLDPAPKANGAGGSRGVL